MTGGARGIGLATARVLCARGAVVALGDLDEQATAAAAASVGPDVIGLRVDVADPASVESFVAAAEEHCGPVDVMINNAGIMPIGPLLDEPHDVARRIVEVNLLGALAGTKAALRSMLPRRRGHIVNVASIAGKAAVPGGVTYGASKAAVLAATESARVEFADSGIFFTCVIPSFTATELISGTSGTRFIRTVEPTEVGEAIADGVLRRRADIYVPGVLGPIARAQALLGRSVRDLMNRFLGADRTFLEIDKDARRAYVQRVDAGE